MFLNDITNKEKLYRIIINELKCHGIKFRREKHAKCCRGDASNEIFSRSLHLLDLTKVQVNGGTISIPTFIYDACNFVIANINTEGLFRKAGSSARQKQIKISLESGHKILKQYHVIDVANILKSFFRDLPEPIIPPGNMQDSMLKCLISTNRNVENILLTCLLLPPITLNVLAYFMQFLKQISECSFTNKMTIENLSIIFAPGLMPLNQLSEERLNGHVRVISLLIANASKIGVIPDCLLTKEINLTDDINNQETTVSGPKRKARRSGSLTRMFNGLRKIVGGIGSNEKLNNISPDSSIKPCISKSSKKRTFETPNFSAKKKKNILAMQQQSNFLTTSTPIKKNKLRVSLDDRGRNIDELSIPNNLKSPRRCSSIESPQNWNQKFNVLNLISTSKPQSSCPCLIKVGFDINQSFSNEITKQPKQSVQSFANEITNQPKQSVRLNNIFRANQNESTINSDYVKIPVEEYIEIKERVQSLEKRISEEFKITSYSGSICPKTSSENVSGPEKVHNEFKHTIEKVEIINENSISGQIANHLKQDLRIRNKSELIIRSPSARKIGTIRRRSRELIVSAISQSSINIEQTKEFSDYRSIKIKQSSNSKTNLKRGRPNTVTTGLINTLVNGANDLNTNYKCITEYINSTEVTPRYTQSLKDVHLQNCSLTALPITAQIKSKTKKYVTDPNRIKLSNSNSIMRTSLLNKKLNNQINGSDKMESIKLLLEIENQTGRESIARIRTENAGMVLEKAKLFNRMSNKEN